MARRRRCTGRRRRRRGKCARNDGRSRRAGRAFPLRPRAQGLPRHRAQHDVKGLVHGRGRRSERRLLPDDRQHERRDAAVRRHRRLDVHRSADSRHDVLGQRGRPGRHGVRGHGDGKERPYQIVTDYLTDPARNALLMQVSPATADRPRAALAVRPLRPDGERQRRRRQRERRSRQRDDRHLDRSSGPGRVRHRHGDERGEPRLRAARLPRARRAVQASVERLRGTRERRSRATRRLAHAHETYSDCGERERRADGARVAPGPATGASRSRSASAARRATPWALPRARSPGGFGRRSASTASRPAGRSTTRRSIRHRAQPAGHLERRARRQLADEYYVSANVLKASRTRPSPARSSPSLASPWGQAVSAGDPNEHLLRLVPRGLRPRPVRDLDRADRRRRPGDGARRDARSCSTGSSSPTGRCRATASSTARRRPTRSTRSSTRAPYPLLMARPAAHDRPGAVHRPHQARPRTS